MSLGDDAATKFSEMSLKRGIRQVDMTVEKRAGHQVCMKQNGVALTKKLPGLVS
jgi:hypothetical protein